jgi:hypothetical protein
MPHMTQTPLIVETGSIVTGANSFVSVADAAQYLYDRGLVGQNDIDAADGGALLRRGLDAIKHLPCLAGYALPLQSVTVIPQNLINAQIWAAYYIWAGQANKNKPASAADPANLATAGVKRKKVDVIEIGYLDSTIKTSVTIDDMPNVVGELTRMGCDSLTVKPAVLPYAGWV